MVTIVNNTVLCTWGGFPGGSVVMNLPASAGDAGSTPGLGRSSGEGNGNWEGNSILAWEILDKGTWLATLHGVTKESEMSHFYTKKWLFCIIRTLYTWKLLIV